MRNSHNITLTNNDSLTEDENHMVTAWCRGRFYLLVICAGDADVDLWL